jgi:hypothetical protein
MKISHLKDTAKKVIKSKIVPVKGESAIAQKHRLYGLFGVFIMCLIFISIYFLTQHFHIRKNSITLFFAIAPLILTIIYTYIVSIILKLPNINFTRSFFISSIFGLPNIIFSFINPSQKMLLSHPVLKSTIIFIIFFLSYFLFRFIYSINNRQALKSAIIYTIINAILMALLGMLIGYIFSHIIIPRL